MSRGNHSGGAAGPAGQTTCVTGAKENGLVASQSRVAADGVNSKNHCQRRTPSEACDHSRRSPERIVSPGPGRRHNAF